MTDSAKSLKSTGFIQWNVGGWFGGCLGGVAWMLPMTFFLLNYHQYALAAISALGFVLSIAISIMLWRNRCRVSPMTAHLLILGIFSVEIPVLLALVTIFGSTESLNAMDWPESLIELVIASLIAPGLMLWLYVVNSFAHIGNRQSQNDPSLNDPQNEV